jgi:hypothetical protein
MFLTLPKESPASGAYAWPSVSLPSGRMDMGVMGSPDQDLRSEGAVAGGGFTGTVSIDQEADHPISIRNPFDEARSKTSIVA